MQTRSKLALLELVGGLFGWVWILASVASIYFLIAALAFNGRWPNLFWAFGIGVVAKWLARGFNDHQKRVAYEAELVSRGVSPEEAREAWFKAYTHGSPSPVPPGTSQAAASSNSSEAVLLEAQELVNKYGAVLEQSKTVTRSEAVLPAPKEQIKDAVIALAPERQGLRPERLSPYAWVMRRSPTSYQSRTPKPRTPSTVSPPRVLLNLTMPSFASLQPKSLSQARAHST